MSPEERDAFLAAERVCRVATVKRDGSPHVAPLWFVWDGTALWLNSIVRSQRWTDLAHQPRVSVVVDAGDDYHELRGVEISGSAEAVGDVPRSPTPDRALETVEHLYASKYSGIEEFRPDDRHAWLRVTAMKIVSWDFRKLR
ncbi:pyridoxamine 5'-phosphate oxidase family protein [Streptomyces sp. NPDC021080]|uniref:pyridoxamine 5'-phosphate oxidase family protein n=1 Tax=Streptomyces sp. NPDC021080 TaxID=3365110 RepID=UPI0037A97EC7